MGVPGGRRPADGPGTDRLTPSSRSAAERREGWQRLFLRPLRIAQLAPPFEPVPPRGYGGTERIVSELTEGLVARGHEVTLFASGDSVTDAKLVPTALVGLRSGEWSGDPSGFFALTVEELSHRAEALDLVHGHLEWWNLVLARTVPGVPVVGTFHTRLDQPFAQRLLGDSPLAMVAISRSQASQHPDLPWAGIVHNGLSFESSGLPVRRTDDLVFVGRITPEKGILDAIEVARLSGRRLRVVAKEPYLPSERDYFQDVFRPAMANADVDLIGELGAEERDRVVGSCHASLMPAAWPEPFGLTAIESLACGTPVIARRAGALPEVIREGIDGFFGADPPEMAFHLERVGGLDRSEIRSSVIERFSATRMVDAYEDLYARVLVARGQSAGLVADERSRLPAVASISDARRMRGAGS